MSACSTGLQCFLFQMFIMVMARCGGAEIRHDIMLVSYGRSDV